MKKLLSILAAVGLTTTASTAVVACGSSKSENDDSASYTGSKKTIKQEVEVKNNAFTLEMTLPKGEQFDNLKSDNWDVAGQIVDKSSTGTTFNALLVVKTSAAKAGNDITSSKDDILDWDLSVNKNDLKDNTTIEGKDDDAIATLSKDMKVKVTFALDDPNESVKDGETISVVLVKDYEDDNDENKTKVNVISDLYDLTLKLAK